MSSDEPLKKLADVADKYGRDLSVAAAGMRDEIAKKMGEDIADQVILNAIIEQLAFVVTGVVSDQKGEDLNNTIKKDLDGIRKDIHMAMTKILHDRTGKCFFLEISPGD